MMGDGNGSVQIQIVRPLLLRFRWLAVGVQALHARGGVAHRAPVDGVGMVPAELLDRLPVFPGKVDTGDSTRRSIWTVVDTNFSLRSVAALTGSSSIFVRCGASQSHNVESAVDWIPA